LPNIPLALVMAALGAVQLGIVAAQPLPQFYKGTDNAPEGLAWTQERGAEIITDKQGRVKSKGSSKGAQLTKLEKGDKVYTAEKTRQILHDNALNNILMQNGILSFAPVFSSPEYKNQSTPIDYDKMGGKFIDAVRQIPEGDKLILSIDKLGQRQFEEKQGQMIENMNRRVRGIGINTGRR
jgi:hypothetical protein